MDHLQTKAFLRNVGPVIWFAFAGTFLSCVVTAMVIFSVGVAGAATFGPEETSAFTGLESLIFGALIAATDPVTVLSVFGSQANPNLDVFSLIFGESVLNDAIAIILYGALDTLREDTDERTQHFQVVLALASTVYLFFAAFMIGLCSGMASSLLFKHLFDGSDEHFTVEQGLLVVCPLMSWMLAEGLGLSGIVSILFCGMAMSYYTRQNLSRKAKGFAPTFFRVIASTCDSVIFIYIGLAVFSFEHSFHPQLIMVSVAAIVLARAVRFYI